MDFSKLLIAIFCLSLAACTASEPSNTDEEHNIGQKLQPVSTMTKQNGQSKNSVLIFDETIRQVHRFDVDTAQHVSTVAVANANLPHTLMTTDDGAYFVDFYDKKLTIYNSAGQIVDDTINFVGLPRSAAFRPDLGFIAVYDSLMNVIVVKIDSTGHITKSWVGGSIVSGNDSISAGDINDDGKLVLALSNDKIAVADINSTLNSQSWQATTFPSGISGVNFVAPLPNNKMMIRSNTKIAVVDLGSQSVTSQFDATDYKTEKLSKLVSPHVILRKNEAVTLVSANGGSIETKTLSNQPRRILYSQLDVPANIWSFVDVNVSWNVNYDFWTGRIYNQLDEVRTSRTVKRYRHTDLAALASKGAPDAAQLVLSKEYLFALQPSELGFAQLFTITTSEQPRTMKGFNKGKL
jgi:hypothetical protein